MAIGASLKRLAKVASAKAPVKTVYYAVMTRLSASFAARRRFEFEKLYAQDGDPWDYASRPYEQKKYRDTLEVLLANCHATASALEVGCSIGVFTRMMAPLFGNILAIDLSSEAVRVAASNVAGAGNVEVQRVDFLSLDAKGRTFDVIFFAEVLYYLSDEEAPDVCSALHKLLSERGVFIVVHPVEPEAGPLPWHRIFGHAFEQLVGVIIEEPERPYEISIYSRRGYRTSNLPRRSEQRALGGWDGEVTLPFLLSSVKQEGGATVAVPNTFV
jgi:SAM-dependent methyltransferase